MATKQQLTFKLHYQTNDPQVQLVWVGEMGELPMQDRGGGWWVLTTMVEMEELPFFLSYHYRVQRAGQIVRREPPMQHTLQIGVLAPAEVLTIVDRWIEASPWHRLQSGSLADLLQLPRLSAMPLCTIQQEQKYYLLFETDAPYQGTLYLSGAHERLGGWAIERARPLSRVDRGWLYSTNSLEELTDFKLFLQRENGEIIWEQGENRELSADHFRPYTLITLQAPDLGDAVLPLPKQLRGTAVPLFSLRTERSYGVGDFSDAVALLDWLEATEQSILQLLPFYDTTFHFTERDSYPYNAITTFGLHPLYMDVRQLPYYAEAPKRVAWEQEAERLNRLDAVAYHEVVQHKSEVMDYCFSEWYESGAHLTDEEVAQFVEEQGEELLAYALFCTIRDRKRGALVETYPDYATIREEWLAYRSIQGIPAEEEVWKHLFRQYHLYQQLAKLKEEASQRGILLKGDLPIGVAKNSVDVWVAPHLFHLDRQAGSPPDAFSAEGQNWGFPTYHWEQMRLDGYEWWQARMSSMSQYIDAIRIDHILGFFRIWSIPAVSGRPIDGYYVPAEGYAPTEVKGLEAFFVTDSDGICHPLLFPEREKGFPLLSEADRAKLLYLRDQYYYHRNEALWKSTALERISHVMQASEMLICAEDLGVLPKSMQEVLTSMELLSLEVVRMPKHLGTPFVRPDQIPYLSVLTTGTHDMPSLRAWWAALTEAEQQHLAELYHFTEEVAPSGLVRALTKIENLLLILPLQDWFVLTDYATHIPPEAEQINRPEDAHHVWQYRMPATIEQLPILSK